MKNKKAEKISQSIKELHLLRAQWDPHTVRRKYDLLQKISEGKFTAPGQIADYHSLLLFFLAYTPGKQFQELVVSELDRVEQTAKEIFAGKNQQLHQRLTNSGIAFTRINVSFSLDLVKWLMVKFPGDVDLFSIDADDQTVSDVLCACLPDIERDVIADKLLSASQMINKLKKRGETQLNFLINLIDNSKHANETKDILWNSLKLFVRFDLKQASLTFCRSIERKIFFHKNSSLKHLSRQHQIRNGSFIRTKMTQHEKKELLTAAKIVLAVFLRETDTVTYADEEQTELFDMGRGIDIALFTMVSSRRITIESYVGYVAFKNRVPVAYGGGWIFLHRCKIGVNIFPYARGGESSYIFTQILRLYHHQYNLKKFIVEPYQFGKKNIEGLQSGAFWFYYRLGFRSVNKLLGEIATAEFKKIEQNKSYRSPLSTLRKLTGSNLELNLANDNSFPDFAPLSLSESVNNFVKEYPGSDRVKIMDEAMNSLENLLTQVKSWSGDEMAMLRRWSVIIAMMNTAFDLNENDLNRFINLIRIKATGSEREFTLRFQKEKQLVKQLALVKLAGE